MHTNKNDSWVWLGWMWIMCASIAYLWFSLIIFAWLFNLSTSKFFFFFFWVSWLTLHLPCSPLLFILQSPAFHLEQLLLLVPCEEEHSWFPRPRLVFFLRSYCSVCSWLPWLSDWQSARDQNKVWINGQRQSRQVGGSSANALKLNAATFSRKRTRNK